jgi:ABC-type spermidine/putrescine transport system permease subunit II
MGVSTLALQALSNLARGVLHTPEVCALCTLVYVPICLLYIVRWICSTGKRVLTGVSGNEALLVPQTLSMM